MQFSNCVDFYLAFKLYTKSSVKEVIFLETLCQKGAV